MWNQKAKKGIVGRTIRKNVHHQQTPSKTIWMHCASLGEFEQGRPIVEALKKAFPQYNLVISFFSASGYEVASKYPLADRVVYLPFDGKNSSAAFIDEVNPAIVIWVKYEYWYWYLSTLKKQGIPLLLVSAYFRQGQPFFKWYGGLHREMLSCFTHLFIQNDDSEILIKDLLPLKNYSVVGDTRFDRVIALKNQHEALPGFVSAFAGDNVCVVAGSTWPEDELQLMHFVKANPQMRFFIVPHEIDQESIEEVRIRFPQHLMYTDLLSNDTINQQVNVVIVDTIGVLSRLYQYSKVAYIGGGFNESGIHNCLEAAVWGNALVFGPVFEKFAEAKALVNLGAATSIGNPVELDQTFNELLSKQALLEEKRNISKQFVENNKGATSSIVQFIQEKRLLTS